MKSATFLIAVALLSGAAYAADTRAAPPAGRPYYYWLHPKLGMVKVDRQTNAMVTGARGSSQQRVDGARAAPAGR